MEGGWVDWVGVGVVGGVVMFLIRLLIFFS